MGFIFWSSIFIIQDTYCLFYLILFYKCKEFGEDELKLSEQMIFGLAVLVFG